MSHTVPPAPMSGYSVNNQLSPLTLSPDSDPTRYIPTSHLHHSDRSSVHSLSTPSPLARASMERSGFWRDPEPSILQDSPSKRIDAQQQRDVNASYLDPLTLRRLQRANPIEAENGGAGPRWGSTTTNATFSEHETSHDRFRKVDRSLIGSREPTSFTREHVVVPVESAEKPVSITRSSYPRHQAGRDLHWPDRTAMTQSGFATAAVPTHTKVVMLADVAPGDLPQLTLAELKRKNTAEYQNLFEPNPYRSVHQISYRKPEGEGGGLVRRGPTGYGSNERVIVGPPGDRREFRTQESVTATDFPDPGEVRGGMGQQIANVVERSGFWSA